MITFITFFKILLFCNCGMLSSKHSNYYHLNQETAVAAHIRPFRSCLLAFVLKSSSHQILPGDLSPSCCIHGHLYTALPSCTWAPALRKCYSKCDCKKLPQEWTLLTLCNYGEIEIHAVVIFLSSKSALKLSTFP